MRSYTFFDTLRTLGLDGADTFNVTTAASGPSRDLFVDGGLASGKKKSTDNLNIFYTPPRPRIIHSAETQDPTQASSISTTAALATSSSTTISNKSRSKGFSVSGH